MCNTDLKPTARRLPRREVFYRATFWRLRMASLLRGTHSVQAFVTVRKREELFFQLESDLREIEGIGTYRPSDGAAEPSRDIRLQ
jgi:hypothetical protein